MSVTYTPNLHLGKQTDHSDKFDMNVITDNMDKIDEALDMLLETYTRAEIDAKLGKVIAQTALNRSSLGLQRKNLAIPNPNLPSMSRGVTITRNNDDSLTLNGTVLESGSVIFGLRVTPNLSLKQGECYILSGCIPDPPNGVRLDLFKDAGGNVSAVAETEDTGTGAIFTIKETSTYYVRLRADNGTTFNGETFYPMIRPAEIEDDTYEPYQPSLQEQIDELKAQIAAQGKA